MTASADFFLIKDQNGGFHKISYDQILFVKSMGNYLQFVTTGAFVTTHGSLQALLAVLEDDARFMRIHRSYVVNLDMIEHISPEEISVGKQKIPIGSKYAEIFKTSFIQKYLIKL